MQAPLPNPVVLGVDRTRCSCGTETLVFAPKPWYHGQRSVPIEPVCAGCGKSLLEKAVPEGGLWEVYALAAVPTGLARAVSSELGDEVTASRTETVPEPPGGVTPARWAVPHEAPPEYEAWLAKRPPRVAPVSRAELQHWLGSLALVALYVVFCVAV